MKKFLIVSLFLSFNLLFSQEEVGYMVTKKGEKIICYSTPKPTREYLPTYGETIEGYVALISQYIYYYNEEGKRKRKGQSNVEEINYHYLGKRYINLRSVNRTKRLHEIIAENDKYILTQYYTRGLYLYVYDKNKEKHVVKFEKHSAIMEDDVDLLEKKIKPYFGKCASLIELIESNIKEDNYYKTNKGRSNIIYNILFDSITNFKCE